MSNLERIKEIEREIVVKHDQIRAIRAACRHDWQPSRRESPDCSHPRCVECGENKNGWWCETSPTKTCDYYDPSRPERYRWNMDCCRYCGQPEERK